MIICSEYQSFFGCFFLRSVSHLGAFHWGNIKLPLKMFSISHLNMLCIFFITCLLNLCLMYSFEQLPIFFSWSEEGLALRQASVSAELMPVGPYSRARISSTSARGLHAHKPPSPVSWPPLPVPGYSRLLPVLTFPDSSALGMQRLQKWNSWTVHSVTKKRSYLLHLLTHPDSLALFPMPLMLSTNSSLCLFPKLPASSSFFFLFSFPRSFILYSRLLCVIVNERDYCHSVISVLYC